MGTNVKRVIPALTLEEQEMINIEARRTSAESALQETANANRTLEQKMAKVQSDIDAGLKTIEINNSEVEKIKKSIVDLQASQVEESKKFEELKKNIILFSIIENNLDLSISNLFIDFQAWQVNIANWIIETKEEKEKTEKK